MERTFIAPVDERQVLEILNGDIRTQQEPRPRIVRLYLSSTVGDVDLERDCLYRDIFHVLHRLSFAYGLQFQLIDLQHDVPLGVLRDRVTVDLVSREVALCQQLTVGPSLITLLAQRYGHCPLPARIPAKVWQSMADAAAAATAPCDDPQLPVACSEDLVADAYRLDENAAPPAYCLRAKEEMFPDILSQDESKVREAMEAWRTVEQQLSKAVKAAVISVVKEKAARVALLMSVVEAELTQGVFLCKDDPNTHVFWMKRFLISLKQQMLKEPAVAKLYLDSVVGVRAGRQRLEIDVEAQKLINSLRDDKMVAKYVGLEKSNVFSYDLRWIVGGVDPGQNKLHREYLEKFSKDALRCLEQCLHRNFAAYEQQTGDSLYQEVLQHIHDMKKKSQRTRGRDAVVDCIEKYLLTKNPGYPLVVHGPQGSGKSACVGQAVSRLRERFGNSVSIVIRSIEATPSARNVRELLHGVCLQLHRIFCPGEPELDIGDNFRDLLVDFPRYLTFATANHPLFVVLDGLDHLLPTHGALNLEWLPLELPANVHVLTSTSGEAVFRCLPELQNRLKGREKFVEVPDLSVDECRQLAEERLQTYGRALTEAQWAAFLDTADLCSTPQFVTLSVEHVLRFWTSQQNVDDLSIPATSRDVVFSVLERVEERFGWQLVNHALGYVTAGKHGLSEPELLDILSCDEKIMDELSLKMTLPRRRFPFLLWSELRQALGGLVSFSGVDNCCVLRWSSHLVADAARDRYLTRTVKQGRHSALADFFLGKWSGRAKPFRCKQRVEDGILATDTEEDRQVMPQPLVFGDGGGHDASTTATTMSPGVRYNMRKLSELPFQLVGSGRLEALRHRLLYDYSWLLTKIRACGVAALIADFDPVVPHLPQSMEEFAASEELRLLRGTLVLANTSLRRSSGHFGAELLARLLPLVDGDTERPFLKTLVLAAREDTTASLTPLGCPFRTAGQHLMSELRSHSKAVTCLAMKIVPSKDDRLQCGGRQRMMLVTGSADGTARYWDAFSGDMQLLLEGHRASVTAVALDNAGDVCATGDQSGAIRVWTLQTGVCEASMTGHKGSINDLAMLSHSHRTISVGDDGTVRFWNSDLASSGLGKELFTLHGHTDDQAVASVVLSSDESRVFSGAQDGEIIAWGQLSGEKQLVLRFHTAPVSVLCAVPQSYDQFVSGSHDRSLALWDVARPQRPTVIFRGHTAPVSGAHVDRRRSRLITCAQDASVRVWDLTTGGKLLAVPVSPQPLSLLHCVGGRLALTAQTDGTVSVLDLDATPYAPPAPCHRGRVTAMLVVGGDGGDDDGFVISGSQDGGLLTRSLRTGRLVDTLQCQSPVKAMALLPMTTIANTSGRCDGGEQATSGSCDGKDCTTTMPTSSDDNNSSNDAENRNSPISFLTGHADGQMRHWQRRRSVNGDIAGAGAGGGGGVVQWECVRTFVKHRKPITAVALACAGTRAVTASDDATALVWDVGSGRVLARLTDHRAALVSVCVREPNDSTGGSGSGDGGSESGPLLAITASKDGTANVYDITAAVHDVAACQGNGSGSELQVTIPDVRPRCQLRARQSGGAALSAVAVSHDGRQAFTASSGRAQQLCVWSVDDGALLSTVDTHATITHLESMATHIVVVDDKRRIAVRDGHRGDTVLASVLSEGDVTAIGCHGNDNDKLVAWGDRHGGVHRAVLRLGGDDPLPWPLVAVQRIAATNPRQRAPARGVANANTKRTAAASDSRYEQSPASSPERASAINNCVPGRQAAGKPPKAAAVMTQNVSEEGGILDGQATMVTNATQPPSEASACAGVAVVAATDFIAKADVTASQRTELNHRGDDELLDDDTAAHGDVSLAANDRLPVTAIVSEGCDAIGGAGSRGSSTADVCPEADGKSALSGKQSLRSGTSSSSTSAGARAAGGTQATNSSACLLL